jgi:hypothetical protein
VEAAPLTNVTTQYPTRRGADSSRDLADSVSKQPGCITIVEPIAVSQCHWFGGDQLVSGSSRAGGRIVAGIRAGSSGAHLMCSFVPNSHSLGVSGCALFA